MRKMTRLGLATGAALGLATLAAPVAAGAAGAAGDGGGWNPGGANHVVFVQTDNASGNQVVAYDRAADGALTWSHTYATGGLGGVLTGSVGGPSGLPGLPDLRPEEQPALRGERRQQHRVGLFGAGRSAHPAPGGELRRVVPGERGGARQPRLRAQRRERWDGPGVRRGVRPSWCPCRDPAAPSA